MDREIGWLRPPGRNRRNFSLTAIDAARDEMRYGVNAGSVMCFDLQALESRRFLSVSVTAAAGVLRIVGDAANQTVSIFDTPISGRVKDTVVSLDADGDGTFTNDPRDLDSKHFVGIRSIVLSLKGGDDTAQFSLVDEFQNLMRSLTVDLGDGNDSFSFREGAGNRITTSRFNINVTAGAGDDTATLAFPGLRQGSQLNARLDMGFGNDSAAVNLPWYNACSGNSRVTFDLRTGPGDDQARAIFGMDVREASEIRYTASLGTGNDTFSGNLDYEEFDNYGNRLSVDVRGEAGNDELVMGSIVDQEMYTRNLGRLQIGLDGGAGNDRTDVLLGRIMLDGGAFYIRTHGGIGADTGRVELLTSPQSTGGLMDVYMFGDSGNDNLSISIDDSAGNSTYGPKGACRLDGGAGTDTKDVSGNGKVIARGFEA